MATTLDIPMLITSTTASAERRITPSWTIRLLKQKLEPITGIPASSQKLTLKLPDDRDVAIEAKDEDKVQVAAFEMIPYAEINVKSLDPAYGNILKADDVPKFKLPDEIYTKLPSTVLAYKKAHQIGRFDPQAPENQERKISAMWKEIEDREIAPNSRARLAGDRHGTVRYVGEIPELGPGPWVGIELDEPSGKNDGSVKGKRYFGCESGRGVFSRENRVEIGDWGLALTEELGSDMEEI